MVWRGGDRFIRCLDSIHASRRFFDRVLISVTSSQDSDDMRVALAAQEDDPSIEVLCTGHEMPTMEHQAFWIDYLISTGVAETDWIYWLAYDDEVRLPGVQAAADSDAQWNLTSGTAYFGPWAMRHEDPQVLWNGDRSAMLESWTSFPVAGPMRLSVAQWIRDQLSQPTYMQMSGSVNQFRSFHALKERRPHKNGPMRIEMVIAASPDNRFVEEFEEPVSIIYGRSNSDRASYGKEARREDVHLMFWLMRYSVRHPNSAPLLAWAVMKSAFTSLSAALGMRTRPQEEWRVRGMVRA